MQFSRYKQFNYMIDNYFSSKLLLFKPTAKFSFTVIKVSVGPYKVNSPISEYSLMLSNLTAQPTQTNFQFHGKRRRRTVLLDVSLMRFKIWLFLDKFLWEFIPQMQDFITPKSKKKYTNSFTVRFRQKLSLVEDFEDVIESSMYDTHKGIYLPLTIHFKLNKLVSSFYLETYLRMLGLPISLYNRKTRPAFDDKVVFSEATNLV